MLRAIDAFGMGHAMQAKKWIKKAIQELSIFTADYFSVDCQKLKPRLGQSGQNPVHQSEVDVNTCNQRKEREKRVRADNPD